MLIVYYVHIAMLLSYSIIRNLSVMFRVTLLSWGATALWYDDGGWFGYINLVELCWLCTHHMFLKVNHAPFVVGISSKMIGGRKLKLWGSLVVALKYMCLFQKA